MCGVSCGIGLGRFWLVADNVSSSGAGFLHGLVLLLAYHREVYSDRYCSIFLLMTFLIQSPPTVYCLQTTFSYTVPYKTLMMKTLQLDIDRLKNWCDNNDMNFNAGKTKVMHITRSRHIHPPIYKLGNNSLEAVKSFQYLGLTIDSNLSRATHTTSTVARANRLLGFIQSVARGSSPKAIFSLYRSLVLPILEYGLPAWHPYTSSQQHLLERVQRTATRLALGQRRGEMSYEDRLQWLHWHSLIHRRNYLLSSFVFKVLHGISYYFSQWKYCHQSTSSSHSKILPSLRSHRFFVQFTFPSISKVMMGYFPFTHSGCCCNRSSADISLPT